MAVMKGCVQVHRLVVVDQDRHVKGIVSLSDLLNYIVLRPMGKPSHSPSLLV